MRIEIELIGNKADQYEISTQILDLLLKTSANVGYELKSTTEDGKIFVTSRKRYAGQHRNECCCSGCMEPGLR